MVASRGKRATGARQMRSQLITQACADGSLCRPNRCLLKGLHCCACDQSPDQAVTARDATLKTDSFIQMNRRTRSKREAIKTTEPAPRDARSPDDSRCLHVGSASVRQHRPASAYAARPSAPAASTRGRRLATLGGCTGGPSGGGAAPVTAAAAGGLCALAAAAGVAT